MVLTDYRLGRIGVLMGGPSTEREISLKSGQAVYRTLKEAGIDAVAIDITNDNKEKNIKLLESLKIDCAFIALHGRFGEDGEIQMILDGLGIPYTGSGASASRLALDKQRSRIAFATAGLDIPQYKVVNRYTPILQGRKLNGDEIVAGFTFPLIVKPNTHGSSVGLTIVEKRDDFERAVDAAFEIDETVLIEEFVAGRELTVGILDEKPLPIVEILPKNRIFDYEAKYNSGTTDYIVPAKLRFMVAAKVKRKALIAHRALGCAGFSRVDIILTDDLKPVILEVNSIPGFTPASLLPKAAKAAGLDFFRLCVKLITFAYEQAKNKPLS